MREVWITGAGIISALGKGVRTHSNAVSHSLTGLSSWNLFNGEPPDPCICGKVPAEAMDIDIEESAPDRANLLLVEAMNEACTSASLPTPTDADCIVGTTLGNMHGGTCYYRRIQQNGVKDVSLVKHFLPCAPITYVAKKLGITGKRWTVASACGSAASAIGHAFRKIRRGKRECILAGGFEALSPFVVAGFNSLQLVSKKESRPFDKNREGLNPGEGAAILVLESKESALSRNVRPLGAIAGFGDALDAYHHTASHPEGLGLFNAISDALKDAGLKPQHIDHIHLHGTGTKVNDDSEYNALKKMFASSLPGIPVCSTKPMTGHTFGASGAINAIFTLITINNGIIPATLFHQKRDPLFTDLLLFSKPQNVENVSRVLSTSLGFGGEAFALIIAKAED